MNKKHNIRKYNSKNKGKFETPSQAIKKRKLKIGDKNNNGLNSHFNNW